MHVLHVMASGAPGGGADHLLALLPALRAAGVQVSALVGDDGPLVQALRRAGVPADARPMLGARHDVRLGRGLHTHAQACGATALHLHGTRAGVLAALAAATLRRPVSRIYSAHGLAHRAAAGWARQGLRLAAEAVACAGTRAVLSVSATDLRLLQRLGTCPNSHSYHLPNVVRLAPIIGQPRLSSDERAVGRRALGLPLRAQLVGSVARLVPQKNVVAAADAVARLPGVHLVAVGEGPTRAELARHPLAAAGRLHLLGARDDVPAILPLCDAFVLSSRWEGEPIALLEAIAWGLPWAATRTAGAQEIACATGSGRLVQQDDSAALAQALSQRLAGGAGVDAEVACGQRALAARRPPQLAARLAQIYRAVLA